MATLSILSDKEFKKRLWLWW